MGTDLVQVTATNTSLPAVQYSPEQWATRRQEFNGWVNTQLRDKIDFGTIKGIDKPTLLKPGAEKIVQLFGCVSEAEITHRESDQNTGYLYVEVQVKLINMQTGFSVGAGIGSCSSFESKYRWRWEWWNGKGEPVGEGWQKYFDKWRRHIANPDLADQWNTVIKMAKKRALVDAALSISGASEKFTQDVEDMSDPEPVVVKPVVQQQAQPQAAQPEAANVEQAATTTTWNDQKTLAKFWPAVKAKGLTNVETHKILGVEHLGQLTCTFDEALAKIDAYLATK